MRSRVLMLVAMLLVCAQAHAEWHWGQVNALFHGYDGQTIVFSLAGWTRTNCTCYSPWPTYMCLDRTRTSFSQDYALLLAARKTGQKVQVNIDETSCKIIAIGEDDTH